MKNFKGVRLTIVVVTLIVGLAVIFGGQYAVKTFYQEEPFKKRVLSIEGIEDVKLVEVKDGQKVYLTVNPEVDVKTAYRKTDEMAQEMLKGEVKVEVDNKSTAQLQDIYHKMHFAIYEGIASGKFTVMAENIEAIGQEIELQDLNVEVDNENVYLKFAKNNQVYTKVLPRKTQQIALQNQGGES